jgi:hypothetical protein
MRNINGDKRSHAFPPSHAVANENAEKKGNTGAPQTKQNAEENPKACTLLQFVSAEQTEGDQGVPTPQRKGREKKS